MYKAAKEFLFGEKLFKIGDEVISPTQRMIELGHVRLHSIEEEVKELVEDVKEEVKELVEDVKEEVKELLSDDTSKVKVSKSKRKKR